MILIQSFTEIGSILSIEKISIYGMFLLIIYLLWRENNQLKSKIDKVITNHIGDLKEANKNMQSVMKSWNSLINEIKDIIRPK